MLSAAYNPCADKAQLVKAYVGKAVSELPMPALVVDLDFAASNAHDMLRSAQRLGFLFRAHVKTHKTMELTRLQLGQKCHSIIVSTLTEAYSLLPLIKEGLNDVLYGVPVARSRLDEVQYLADRFQHFRLMVDNVETIRHLAEFDAAQNVPQGFSVFVKVDCGTHRAGLEADSEALRELIDTIIAHPCITIHGFYCHSGHSYNATTIRGATERFLEEIASADAAARYAQSKLGQKAFVISVGATPTAHVSKHLSMSGIPPIAPRCQLELHAGNYILSDLQQYATSLVQPNRVAVRVLADVISVYPARDEVLVNAGVIALARETSTIPGFGIVTLADEHMWAVPEISKAAKVVRLSQEHGIISPNAFRVGDRVSITPQHACITAQGFPFIFAVSDNTVEDVMPTFHGF